MSEKKKQHKVPLNSMLQAMDTKNRDFYRNLSDEEKKDFSPWLSMRYASSVEGPLGGYSLYAVNEVVNRDFNEFKNHPELQWLMLTAVGTGQKQQHVFIPPGKRGKKDRLSEMVSNMYPHFKSDEIELFIAVNSKDEIRKIAKSNGYSDEEIKQALS